MRSNFARVLGSALATCMICAVVATQARGAALSAIPQTCCASLPPLGTALEPLGAKLVKQVLKAEKLCDKAGDILGGDRNKKETRGFKKTRAIGRRLEKIEKLLAKLGEPAPAELTAAQGSCALAEGRLGLLVEGEGEGVLALPGEVPIPGPECGPSSVCIEEDGFRVTLISIVDDPVASTRSFTYEICGDTDGCPLPPKGLSNFRLDLPEGCVGADQLVSVVVDPDVLTDCEVVDNDGLPPVNQCPDPVGGDVVKCNVIPDDFGKGGECTTVSLVLANEPPVGVGLMGIGTKAGPDCQAGQIIGPSCDPCVGTPPGDECLTRTPGFWGTHPAITGTFLPVTVCGVEHTATASATQGSATEDLCVAPGKESMGADRTPQQLQLYRQLTAAKLNIEASLASGGNCDGAVSDLLAGCGHPDFASLEAALCFATAQEIGQSGCIGALDTFNNSDDSLVPSPPPFDQPGPAAPASCLESVGNGFINERSNL